MALQAGWLNRRVTIARPQTVHDGFGRVAGAPVDLGTFAAAAAPVSDGERAHAAQLQATITVRFLVRDTARARQVDATCAVTDARGQVFGIVGVKEALRWNGVDLRRGEALEISAAARS